jgi:Flp pilus assembly protein TadG
MAGKTLNTKRRRRHGGHAVVELALIGPWVFFLFAGTVDFGFYAHGLIVTEHAVRAAALYTASSPDVAADAAGACVLVLDEMRGLPNVGAAVSDCDDTPVRLTAEAITGPDGAPASRVAITYDAIPMIAIPGLTGRYQVRRVTEMRVRPE